MAAPFFEDRFRKSDRPALEAILAAGGIIFGGYLRDLEAEVAPEDIDCVISAADFEELRVALLDLGYLQAGPLDPTDPELFIKDGALDVEVVIEEMERTSLRPTAIPDAVVNLLGYSRARGLINWAAHPDEEPTPATIRGYIRARRTPIFEGDSLDRLIKLREKGYTLLETVSLPGSKSDQYTLEDLDSHTAKWTAYLDGMEANLDRKASN